MMQVITGNIIPVPGDNNSTWISIVAWSGALYAIQTSITGANLTYANASNRNAGIAFDSSRSPGARTGNQTAGASIAVLPVISY